MGLLDGLKLPTLGEMPRGGWNKNTPAPTRLQKKASEDRDERKQEAAFGPRKDERL